MTCDGVDEDVDAGLRGESGRESRIGAVAASEIVATADEGVPLVVGAGS